MMCSVEILLQQKVVTLGSGSIRNFSILICCMVRDGYRPVIMMVLGFRGPQIASLLLFTYSACDFIYLFIIINMIFL